MLPAPIVPQPITARLRRPFAGGRRGAAYPPPNVPQPPMNGAASRVDFRNDLLFMVMLISFSPGQAPCAPVGIV